MMGSLCGGRRVSFTCDGDGEGIDVRLIERDDFDEEEERPKRSRQADWEVIM